MDAARYARICEIYEAVQNLDPVARSEYLQRSCADDVELREVVESLLAESANPGRQDAFSDNRIDASREQIERLIPTTSPDLYPETPRKIGRYRILNRIASGGMGTVYEAEQDQPKRRVAVKVLSPHRTSEGLVSRFRREAEILGRLKHPGIAQIYDAGSIECGAGQQPYLVMELVDGDPLTKYADAARLDLRARVDLLARICDAVQYAHHRAVIHRDLKPENILVDADGLPKVLDFGIARATDDATMVATQVTQDGQLLGTLAYMAPEQLSGNMEAVSVRSDVYALGVVAFELLSGRLPHDVAGLGISTAVTLLTYDDPPKLGTLTQGTRGDLETIVGKALEKEPARRYGSAAALATDLRNYLEDRPIVARRPSRIVRMRKFTRRNRVLVGGTVATIFTLILGLVAALTLADRERTQRQIALANEQTARINSIKARAALYRSARSDIEAGRRWEAAASLKLVPESERDWAWRFLKRRTPRTVGSSNRRTGAYATLEREPALAAERQHELMLVDQGALHIVDLFDETQKRSPLRVRDLVRITDADANRVAASDIHGNWRIFDVGSGRGTPPQPGNAVFGSTGLMIFVRAGKKLIVREDNAIRAEIDASPETSWTLPKPAQVGTQEVIVVTAIGKESALTQVIDVDSGNVIAGRVHARSFAQRNRGAAVHPDGGSVLIHDAGRVVEVHTMTLEPTGRLYEAAGDGMFDNSIGYASDGNHVWAIRTMGGVRPFAELLVWDRKSGNLLRRVNEPRLKGGDALLEDGRVFAARTTMAESWIINFDELDGVDEFTQMEGEASWLYHLALSHDGSLVAAMAPGTSEVLVWETATGSLLARLEMMPNPRPYDHGRLAHALHDTFVVFSRNDDELLTSERDRALESTIYLSRFDLTTGTKTREPMDLRAAYDAARRASGAARLSQTVFARNGEPFDTHQSRTTRVNDWSRICGVEAILCSAPCGEESLVAVGTPSGLQIIDTEAESVVHSASATTGTVVHALAFSPDGSLLALGTVEGILCILETEFFETILEIEAHPPGHDFAGRQPRWEPYRYIRDICWSPDGSQLLTASGDGSVRIWDSRRLGYRRQQRRLYEKRKDALETSIAPEDRKARLNDSSLSPEDRAALRIHAIKSWSTLEDETAPPHSR